MLFPQTFISALEKIGVGLEKQAANFLFQFHPEKGKSNIPVLTFFHVHNKGIFSYLGYGILI